MIGASITPVGTPAPFSLRTASSRACGDGVPGSASRQTCWSSIPIVSAAATDTCSAARASSGMSRVISVPLVRIENGVSASPSAWMIPGMSRYRPSARWYGSVFVPIATCSPRHVVLATSRRSTSATLVFTTTTRSKSASGDRFR
jgi:hypothetical protein